MKKLLSLALSFILALSLAACGGSAAAEGWQEQYDLGVKYLSELNYEEAVVAFNKAIEIDPKQAEAYVELARVYVAQENKDEAKKVLYKASKSVGADNEALNKAFEELEIEKPSEENSTANANSTNKGNPELANQSIRTDYDDGSYYIVDYDEKGNRIRETLYNTDGGVDWVNDYDEKGNIIRLTQYNADGSVYMVWDYDENGNHIRTTSYRADGSVSSWYINDYDENGNRIHGTRYLSDGTVDSVDDYDENGNLIRRTYYNADGSVDWVDEY